MSGLTTVPTFVLRKIDPAKILENYKNGKYANISIPEEKVVWSNVVSITAPAYGTGPESPIYSFRDSSNTTVVVATSNDKNYQIFTKNGGELPIGGRCLWCRKDYDHVGVGIPIAQKDEYFLINEENKRVSVFWVEDVCCDFECALAHAEMIRSSVLYSDQHYSSSISALKILYRKMYPDGEELISAKDFRLLQRNGGPLTDEEYKNKRHEYKRTASALLIPAKVEYIRL